MSEFFLRNIIPIYFIYGLSFFSMGLAVLLELGHSSELDFAQALRPLAWFGLVHGCHEWFEMFLLMNPAFAGRPANVWIPPLRLALLAGSFILLIAFGARLISGPTRLSFRWGMMFVVVTIWAIGLFGLIIAQLPRGDFIVAADVYSRYSLAIPGAALTVWGLLLLRNRFYKEGMHVFGRDVAIAAIAFGIYGGIGQLFGSPSSLFPSNYLNSGIFLDWFGFPIQLLRAGVAMIAAIFIIHSLRVFEVENRRRIESLRDAQMVERRRLEATRAELLHRTVKAQESERQRIARELHDETGQTLTALGMGLRGLTTTISSNPKRATEQAKHLEALAVAGLEELQRMVIGLHPPQLDDLGLLAALRWYVGEVQVHYDLEIRLTQQGEVIDLPIETRIVLFRIAQEAITNIIRHASANRTEIELKFDPSRTQMIIQDNGCGFNVIESLRTEGPNRCWGLLGMIERANLIGGQCEIISQLGEGTEISVTIPIEKELDGKNQPAAR
jgi:signal transduction histidine kinase